jgi:hypothetical protein
MLFGIAPAVWAEENLPQPEAFVLEWPAREAPPLANGQRLPKGYTTPNHYRSTDWALLIDQTWGPSPLTIAQMLGLFDNFWTQMDQSFACYQDLVVDWTALRNRYRPEIQGGVSRGRFAAIMNHLALALKESHTHVRDQVVNTLTFPNPGIPLLYVGAYGDDRHFGAGLTPLPDSTLLVCDVMSPHPLGLVPGDIVLGYEGIPWKQLYRELLAAELPIGSMWWWGSSDASHTHSWLKSAGINWHLFDTIDVVKYSTGQTVHLPVDPLIGLNFQFDWTEQLPVPGVPKPNFLGAGDRVSWGTIDGTQIGYVYVREWTGNAGIEFTNAVDSLMTDFNTTGLIVDFRTNYGGNMFLAYDALEHLFDEEVWTVGFAERCNPSDHLAMCPSPSGPPSAYVIHGDDQPPTFYNRPIAVLTGPGAVSSGDQVANLFKFHPMVRVFGKTTSTTFNAPVAFPTGLSGWTSRYARYDAYLVSNPTNYLTHDEFQVDEAVWFTPDDVAQGRDTVVEAAKEWIVATSGIAAASPVRPSILLENAPNPFGAATTIRFLLTSPSPAALRIYDPMGRLITTLVDEEKSAGDYHVTWDKKDNRGRSVAAGVYYCRLEAGNHEATTKLVSLK